MRLSALFEEFTQFMRVEKGAAASSMATYRWCFNDFLDFARREIGGPVATSHFTVDLCRGYQYSLVTRELATATVRLRLATLGSFAKWAVRRGRLPTNPLDQLTRPRRKPRLPRSVPRWDTVEALLAAEREPRRRALLALLAYGGLRRSEAVALNVGDFDPAFGLRRVPGKGDTESAVALPAVARRSIADYLATDRPGAPPDAPMFVVRYRTRGGAWRERRMSDKRVWKIVRALGEQTGLAGLHPHAFRHSCGTELLLRTRGNLRAVQEHLRHADIQTTTIYTRLAQPELQQIVSVFDQDRPPVPASAGGHE